MAKKVFCFLLKHVDPNGSKTVNALRQGKGKSLLTS
jgi:hypothetical protein